MNIMAKFTLENMKKNRKRTIVTIIGVIISVAMLTGVAISVESFLNVICRSEIAENGEWEYTVDHVKKDKLSVITKDENTKSCAFVYSLGYSKLEKPALKRTPYIAVDAFTKKTFNDLKIKLIKGRMPENAHEVVVSEYYISRQDSKMKMGDTFTLNLGERYEEEDGKKCNLTYMDEIRYNEKTGKYTESLELNNKMSTYKVVGIIEQGENAIFGRDEIGYNFFTLADKDVIENTEYIRTFVTVNTLDRSFYDNVDQITKKLNADAGVLTHDRLLVYKGISKDSSVLAFIKTFEVILILIVMAASIALIYNAFAISISERNKQLGMLSSIGATKSQKKKSVLFEGLIISFIGIPLGIIAGCIGMGITFKCVNSIFEGAFDFGVPLRLYVSVKVVFIAVLTSFVTIMLSAFIPAVHASRINAIDAIRQAKDIKMEKKKIRTLPITRRIYGVEGTIALRNLKRNKKRYRALIISMFISIVLFVSVSTFTYYARKSNELASGDENYDIVVNSGRDLSDEMVKAKSDLLGTQGVIDASVIYQVNNGLVLSKSDAKRYMTDDFKNAVTEYTKIHDEMYESDSFSYNDFKYYALDDESLEKYAKKIGLTSAQLTEMKEGNGGIIINNGSLREQGQIKDFNLYKIPDGTTLTMKMTNFNDPKYSAQIPIKILKVTNSVPVGVRKRTEVCYGKKMIISQKQLVAITEKYNKSVKEDNRDHINPCINIDVKDRTFDEAIVSRVLEQNGIINSSIYNRLDTNFRDHQFVVIMSIFSYGFIALMSLICCVNLINTTLTNFNLRRKEYAMIRSVGMTPKAFKKMVYLESLFYGIKAIAFAIPSSLLISYGIYHASSDMFQFKYHLPLDSLAIAIVITLAVSIVSMKIGARKVCTDNIMEGLKSENI